MLLATVVIDPPSVIALGAIFTLFAARSIAAGAPLKRSVLVGVWVVLFALTLHRYLHIGSYDDYQAGRALTLNAQPAVVHDFNLATIVTPIGPLALLVAGLWRQRRLTAAPALRT